MNDCKKHLQESQTQLKAFKLKITPARIELLDIFKHAKKPLTVKSILTFIKTKTDPVTLYRNIESLKQNGIIKEVKFSSKEAYYELIGKHHHHIVCENCGKIAEVKNCKVTLPKNSLVNLGFAKLKEHSLEFFGLCNQCA
jgi:Fe2+ or Zn2+ uptake regulation protein